MDGSSLAEMALSGANSSKTSAEHRSHTRKSAGHVRTVHIHKADKGYVVHSEHHSQDENGSDSVTHSTAHVPDSDSLHDLIEQQVGEPAEGESGLAGMPSGQPVQPSQ